MLLKPKTLSLPIAAVTIGLLVAFAHPASAQIIGLTNRPLSAIIASTIDWLLSVAAGLAILFIIIGGIYYVTAAGDDNQMQEGKTIITYSIWGLLFILISYSIVLTVNKIINP
jgi:type IV secretory pathway VirB2 component (pilin)